MPRLTPPWTLDVPFKDSIDALTNDKASRDALSNLVVTALRKALVRGSVEVATMRIGRNAWIESIDGPEDHS